MRAYYNEFDPKAAAWLRELIRAGEIMAGDVDERSIADVRPDDLLGYTRCHFFAGIGGWDYALRLAGWDSERPVWTGSCPCQPFSVAGEGKGQSDPRHLWPEWFRLIRECRPDTIFGEQVEAAIRYGWLDLVQADLEREGYACGPIVLPAAGFGAPHGRHRLWFVADHNNAGRGLERSGGLLDGERSARGHDADGCGEDGGMDYSVRGRGGESVKQVLAGRESSFVSGGADVGCAGVALGDTGNSRLQGRELDGTRHDERHGSDAYGSTREPGCASGFWTDCDWIPCRDGKWRPVEPGTFPLAHGAPARVGRLRGYGNAIVPQVAAEVIAAFMQVAA